MGWGGHRMIDSRGISEDLRYPAPRPGPDTSGVDALGSQETCLKHPPPLTKRQPQESQPIQVCGQQKDPSAAGERHPSQPGPGYQEVAEHAQLLGRVSPVRLCPVAY